MTTAVKVETYNILGFAYTSAVSEISTSAISAIDYLTSGAVSGTSTDQDFIWFLSGTSYQSTIPLIASFTSAISNQKTVSFTNTSSGYMNNWIWNFGDGSTSTDKNPSHTFADYSTSYVVSLSVSGANTSTVSATIVTEAAPVVLTANFTWTGQPYISRPCNFTDTSTGGTATSWSWQLKNQSSGLYDLVFSTVQNPSTIDVLSYGAQYSTDWNVYVKLTVNGTASKEITIFPPPE